MARSHRLWSAADWASLESRLIEEIREVKSEDALRPVPVLVGSNLLGAYLRRRAAEEMPLLGVRFITIHELVSRLSEGTPSEKRRPLSAEAETLLIRKIAAQAKDTYFGRLADQPGLTRVFHAVFDDLRDGNVRDLPASSARDNTIKQKHRDFKSLYASFLDSYRDRFYDDAEAVSLAAAQAKIFSSVLGSDRLIIYGFYDFTEVQWELIRAIAEAASITVLMPFDSSAAFQYAQPAAEEFARILGVKASELTQPESSPHNLEHVARRLFNTDAPDSSPGDEGIKIIAAPGEEREAEEICREILRLIRHEGIKYHEIGIVTTQADMYGPALRDALTRLDIPFYTTDTEPLSHGRTGWATLALLNLVPDERGEFHRQKVMEFLFTADLNIEALLGHPVDVMQWNTWCCEAGIIRGREEWGQRLETLLNENPDNEEDKNYNQGVRECIDFINLFFSDLRSFESQGPWEQYVKLLTGLLKKYLLTRDDELESLIFSLTVLDEISSPVAFPVFREMVAAVLEKATATHGRFQEGAVTLTSLMPARGLRFRILFIPGLTEKVFPASVREDPVLLDDERTAINKNLPRGARLSLKRERRKEARMLFRLLAGAATERLILSYSRLDPESGRELLPSPFLMELGRAVSEGPLDYAGLPHLRGYQRVPLNPFIAGPGRKLPGSDLDALGLEEFDLIHLASADALNESYGERQFLLSQNPSFRRAMIMAQERWGINKFSEFSGKLKGPEVEKYLRQRLDPEKRQVSASQLQSYARCPFAYFCKSVLRLKPVEEPESIMEMPALDLGNIVHDALNQLFIFLREKKLLPLNEARLEKAGKELKAILNELIEDEIESGQTGLPLAWRIRQERLQEEIMSYLREQMESSGDFIPYGFEVCFGDMRHKEGDPLISREKSVTLSLKDGRELQLQGSIDLLMLRKDRKAFRVIDYKTGTNVPRENFHLECGTGLQRAIYFLAGQQILDIKNLGDSSAELHFISGSRKLARRVIPGQEWPDLHEKLKGVVDLILTGILKGRFYVSPQGDPCRYCDVEAVCDVASRKISSRLSEEDEDMIFLSRFSEYE